MAGGTLVHDARNDHRCRPPGCHEWPAGHWHINPADTYPEGSLWRCECGHMWEATARSARLWREWVPFTKRQMKRYRRNHGG